MPLGSNLLIEPQYLPDCHFFSMFFVHRDIILNDNSLFIKQTFRNRAYISGANKVLSLIIPVQKGKTRILFKDVVIDYHLNWPKIHWYSIISSYNKSPFFLYYHDRFEKHFLNRPKFLIDFIYPLMLEILIILELKNNLIFSSSIQENYTENIVDYTNKILPGKNREQDFPEFKFRSYSQVFSDRFGFLPGLSVIDLIFNTGPEAKSYILQGFPF